MKYMRNTTGKYVYFLRRKDGVGPVKIGCSRVPESRLNIHMMWSPYPLEIVAKVPGGHDLERNLHDCFADAHSHSEWFFPDERLLAAMRRIASGTPVAEAVDLNDRRGMVRQHRERKAA